jgi:beta-glucosidase
VTNNGNYDGEEVVQLYIRDVVGSITRPLKELKGFQKYF